MKKYSLILIVFMMLGSCIAAQDTNPNISRRAETTINGKPYSQYKAEQEALKKQKAVQSSYIVRAVDNNNGGAGVATTAPRTTEETTRVQAAPVSHQYTPSEQNAAYTEPVKEKAIEKSMVTVKTEAPKAIPPSELPGAMLGAEKPVVTKEVASRKGTSQDSEAQPVPVTPKQKGNEGGAVTPVESAVVKAPAKDATVPQGKAPVAPMPVEEKTTESGNSTNGEKPAQVPPAKQQ